MVRFNILLLCLIAFEWFAAPAAARAQGDLAGCKKLYEARALTLTVVDEVIDGKDEKHSILDGTRDLPVQIDCDDMQFFADHMEHFQNSGRVTASGNVLFVSGNNRIAAERMEFNAQTRLGTFYVAFGTVTLRDAPNPSLFGAGEPEAYFWGAELHKIGPKKYRLKDGAFTTCVQPTPRWQMVSGSITLTIDEYAVLKNAVFSVKGVPLMYLPVLYYPIQDEDRATGFLMPIYGNSSYRGPTLSNQFFWAIGRSQDATFVHDWFSRTGMGYGGEYRYVRSATADGSARVYQIKEHEATFLSNGQTIESHAREAYEIRASVREQLPHQTRATGYVDYFSDITVQQLYSQNIYDSSLRTRRWGGSASTQLGGFSLSGNYAHSEYFYGDTFSSIDEQRPSVLLSHSAKQLWKTPIYVTGAFNYSNMLRGTHSGTRVDDLTLQRWDGGSGIKVPFSKLTFLSVNSSVGWRGTWYTKSLAPTNGAVVPVGVFRNYFDFRTEVVGPVFTRVFDRPGSQNVARIKHVLEPSIEVRRTTKVENVNQIIKLDGSDYTIGGSLESQYGLTTRVLVKGGGDDAVGREVLSASVHQTYYVDPALSQFDRAYSTSFMGRPPSSFSPIALSARFAPRASANADVRVEYDPIISKYQSISLGGGVSASRFQATGNYSRRLLSASSYDIYRSDNFVSGQVNYRFPRERLGTLYSFNYDIGRSTLIQQRVAVFYNAQCCGVAVEFQRYNYPTYSRFIIPQDKRFNISFTLAGVGTFSNFLGALTGQPTNTR